MAYVTGTVSNGQDLLNVIVTAMTDNGWTLHDTVALNDKVVYSAGTDGYQSMYVRVRNSHIELNYDGYISGFSIGDTVTGGTSGATAFVVGVTEDGATGSLDIVDLNGLFVNDETITSAGGSAVVFGAPTYPDNLNTNDLDNIMNTVYFSMYSYWDAGSNTGVNERCRFGKYYVYGSNSGSTVPTGYTSTNTGLYMVYGQSDGSTREDAGIEIIKSDNLFPRQSQTATNDLRGGQTGENFKKLAIHDSYRRFVGLQYQGSYGTNALGFVDLPSRDMQTIQNNTGSLAVFGYAQGIQFQNRNENKTYRFYYNNIGTTFRTINIDTGEEKIIGLSPFSAVPSSVGGRFAYDGNRYIYVTISTTPEFKRFDLVDQTWSNLANPPFAPTGSSAAFEGEVGIGIYIPANTVSGGGLWAEDRILFVLNMATSPSYVHAYNVQSNSWTNNIITLPAPSTSGSSSLYSDGEYLFYAENTQSLVHRMRLDQITGAWTRVYRDARWQNVTTGNNNTSAFSPRVSKVQFRTNSSFNYGIMVSEDSVAVWTGPNDQYYWAYVGNYEKYGRLPFAIALSSHSLGPSVAVSVSSTEGFEIGDDVNVLNTSSGVSFVARVVDITADLVLSTPVAISAGMQIFSRSSDMIITGDTECGITMYDEVGTSSPTDGNNDIFLEDSSSRQYPQYHRQYALDPIEITWPFDKVGRLPKKGRLTGVYSLAGDTSGIQNKSIVRDSAGQAYIVIMPQKRKLTKENMIAFGPIA